MEIAVTIFLISIIALATLKIYKEYKEYKKLNLEMLFWLVFIIIFIPIIIYYVDKSDLPSKYNWFKNSDSSRWFSFITTYASSIFGATIGAVVLILVTRHEFDVVRENDAEQRRIANLPLLDYDFDIMHSYYASDAIDLGNSKSTTICVGIILKNIGMNTIRKCYINAKSDLIKSNYDYSIDEQCFIEKNQQKVLRFTIPIANNEFCIEFIAKYQDILFNWYEQVVVLRIKIVNIEEDEKLLKNVVLNVKKDDKKC